jgi:structural maintenance of chromosome 1
MNSIQAKQESLNQEKSLLKKRHSVVSETVAQLETKIIETRTQLSEIESEKRASAHKETELHEKLTDVQNRIMQARVDSSTSEREAKFSECLDNMKRAFEGVHGRMLDLCKPGQRKYDLAVQIILGKNLDAVIVDSEKTAIECIQVSLFFTSTLCVVYERSESWTGHFYSVGYYLYETCS